MADPLRAALEQKIAERDRLYAERERLTAEQDANLRPYAREDGIVRFGSSVPWEAVKRDAELGDQLERIDEAIVVLRAKALDELADLLARVPLAPQEGRHMDMRNGDMYASRELAQAAGVSNEHIAEVDVEIVRVSSGPFKGRVYQRNPKTRQLERRFDMEPNTQEA